ncbi:hypothetical protein BD324DRAFT_627151 [Kockovaella imperatae]|uniref:FAD-binding FR-type domain-containing protein n=1 Tax=Kockovaella imperatae TaxID=4999 RepID=A0A1Y1UFF9_9TREE|nr:hypothetical protein BD324DRAFT_627151 [Kockovaella imperatae]ORX36783.1 hypothetical protein BD324DRAFT_627151 [Kockovaella imperatae]
MSYTSLLTPVASSSKGVIRGIMPPNSSSASFIRLPCRHRTLCTERVLLRSPPVTSAFYYRSSSSTPSRRPKLPEITSEGSSRITPVSPRPEVRPPDATPAEGTQTPPLTARPSLMERLKNPSPARLRFLKILGWSMLFSAAVHVGLVIYVMKNDSGELSPDEHMPRVVSKITRLSPRHRYIEIPVDPESCKQFGDQAMGMDGEKLKSEKGAVAVQHVTIKSPAIQVERSYTPINDVQEDGLLKMVVKRVKGGEVGRIVFSAKEGERIWVRGPITTFAINPYQFDRIVMISTGTGVAPFLQFLSKFNPSSSPFPSNDLERDDLNPLNTSSSPSQPLPKLLLLHAMPSEDHAEADWPVSTGCIPRLESKFGPLLDVRRFPSGDVPSSSISSALGMGDGPDHHSTWLPWKGSAKSEPLKRDERVMVLVSLPPAMMDPVCGRMTSEFQQGELTGILKELGLKPHQVWKLE